MTRITLAVALLSAVSPAGQQGPPEMTTHDRTPTFKTEVNMVQVPVVVRDYKGRAVGNLTQDDFQLFDRGKPAKILKFSVEKSVGPDQTVTVSPSRETAPTAPSEPEVAAAVLPQRFVAYLFDDVNVGINDLAMARDAADRHMKRALGAKTRAAIFTTSGQTMLDFTDDRDQLHETFFRLQVHPIAEEASHHDCPDLTYHWADDIRNHNDQEALHMAAMDDVQCRADSKGNQAEAEVRSAVARVIARTQYQAAVAMSVLRGLVQRMSVMPGERTMVLASPGFLTEADSNEAVSFLIDKAIHAGVVINAIDLRGLATFTKDLSRPSLTIDNLNTSTAYGSLSQFLAYRENREIQDFNARMDVLAEIANGTGGTFFHNSNDLDTGFDRVAGNPEYRYILGFSPDNLKADGSLHALKVSIVSNPHHYDVDARRSYTAPKRLDDPAEQAKQEITQAIFSREELRDIPLVLHTEYFKGPQGKAAVTVTTHVDLKALKLRKADGRNRDDLSVTTGMFDRNGNYVAGIERGVDLQLKDENLDKWMANGIQVKSSLEVKPGTYLVRVVVRDSEGQLMAARNASVDIQ